MSLLWHNEQNIRCCESGIMIYGLRSDLSMSLSMTMVFHPVNNQNRHKPVYKLQICKSQLITCLTVFSLFCTYFIDGALFVSLWLSKDHLIDPKFDVSIQYTVGSAEFVLPEALHASFCGRVSYI